ncbi:hypothetical protein CDES_11445 [Corynebacterium deserti GIMN1.010]|uniref:Sodium/calcium exchanger membrane region domain-containing protein n=1 Tax=Corynebacterium deserti GIMN1.010 TaxID=931089 RepID=A0A0M4CRB3_9CORY|nr:sodium:proton exchanger [Corynebacterium deserti]ALC06655.1 hypothetical protein CDES_11445 [Corynebacterium deserti GIMN1.010]
MFPTKSLAACTVLALPAVVFRVAGVEAPPVVVMLVYGTAVVAASFVLAWAAEAVRKDISGALAVALLALVAVLPEYAVDLYYAFVSGSDPAMAQYASANMNGSNRLLLGFGWPLVVLVALYTQRKKVLRLPQDTKRDVAVLLLLTLLSVLIPVSGSIPLAFGVVLIAIFIIHLVVASKAEAEEEPEFVSVAAAVAELDTTTRRITITWMFVISAAVILMAAEPFANSLVAAGSNLGIDSFLLVQWLAPLASEAPEFIVAVLFATRGLGAMAIGTLIASKINQWSLLVGSIPVAHLLGGGSANMALNPRQVEEFTLTITQTLLGVAIIIGLRFHWASAVALCGLFAAQFFVTGTEERLILSAVHVVLAVVVLWINRKHIVPTLQVLKPQKERDVQFEASNAQ